MEIANLWPHSAVRPDIVIADSLYGLCHESMAHLFVSTPISPCNGYSLDEVLESSSEIRGLVISPGVQVETIHNKASSAILSNKVCDNKCGRYNYNNSITAFSENERVPYRCSNCFTVGMICRLSKEKSVGLFLLAIKELSSRCSFCRFKIGGDGPMKAQLELLSLSLGIDHLVTFVGWVSKDDIPSFVMTLDVIVNTGAFREIFNTANLDILALAVPIITFAAGGLGEYIQDPANRNQEEVTSFISNAFPLDYFNLQDMNFAYNELPPFSIGINAIIVNWPCPKALSAAILFSTYANKTRSGIGYAGMETVDKYFQSKKMNYAYEKLFLSIAK